jgi:hypothetical protein
MIIKYIFRVKAILIQCHGCRIYSGPATQPGALFILSGSARMEIGLGLGFSVFIVTFHADFNGLLFVLVAVEVFVNFDRGQIQCH